jgi:hypothetical protein
VHRPIPSLVFRSSVLLLLVGCDTTVDAPPIPELGTGAVVAGIVAGMEDRPIGRPTAAAVDADGVVWVADALNHNLRRVDLESGESTVIGREGQGPGEFRRPEGVVVGNGEVWVLDFGNGRIQRLSRLGEAMDSNLIDSPLYLPLTLGPGGSLAAPTLGQYESLVAWRPSGGGETRYLGAALAAMPVEISPRRIREQVAAGSIPQEFQNNVLPVVRPEGGVWVISQVEGTIQLFSDTGALAWEQEMPEAYTAGSRARFLDAWAQPSVQGIPVPWAARAGTSVQGDLWLVVDAPEGTGSHLLVYDGEAGHLTRRESLPLSGPASCIAVHPDTPHRMILCLPDDATVVQVDLDGTTG